MVMFAENDYNPEEHARLLEALWGKEPEGEINLIEGDEDAVTLKGLPPDEPKKQ